MGGWVVPAIGGGIAAGTAIKNWIDPSTATRSKNTLFSQGKSLGTSGMADIGTGKSTLSEPTRYYENLLGNRQSALQAASPEVSTIQGQAETSAKAASQFAPRGGGRVAASASNPQTTAASIQNLISNQRPEAAAALTNIGGMLDSLGLSEAGLSMESLASAAGIDLKQQQMSNDNFAALGKAAGNLLQMWMANR